MITRAECDRIEELAMELVHASDYLTESEALAGSDADGLHEAREGYDEAAEEFRAYLDTLVAPSA